MSEEEIVVAYPPDTAPRKRWVTAADLAGARSATPRRGSAIKAAIDDVLRRAGEQPQLALESGDPYLIRCLVSDGFGAAVLPASITRRAGPAGRDAPPAARRSACRSA